MTTRWEELEKLSNEDVLQIMEDNYQPWRPAPDDWSYAARKQKTLVERFDKQIDAWVKAKFKYLNPEFGKPKPDPLPGCDLMSLTEAAMKAYDEWLEKKMRIH